MPDSHATSNSAAKRCEVCGQPLAENPESDHAIFVSAGKMACSWACSQQALKDACRGDEPVWLDDLL